MTDKTAIVKEAREEFRKRFGTVDEKSGCLYLTLCVILVARRYNIHLIPQAGTASWERVTPEQDDGIVNTHFSYVMGADGVPFTRTRDDLVFGYRSTNITSKFILEASFRIAEDDSHRILRQVKEIWIYKKNSQPLGHPNAGCIFKNPRGLSAGALIDRAGVKGRRVGGAYVSDKHANFILADEGATAADFLKLT